MTVLHTGSTKKFSEGWDAVFTGRKASRGAGGAAVAAKPSARKTAKKSPAAKVQASAKKTVSKSAVAKGAVKSRKNRARAK